MAKVNRNAHSWEFGPLKSYLPCYCYQDPLDKGNSYSVTTGSSSSYVFGDGPTITHIHIICNTCGREIRADVSSLNILESSVSF